MMLRFRASKRLRLPHQACCNISNDIPRMQITRHARALAPVAAWHILRWQSPSLPLTPSSQVPLLARDIQYNIQQVADNQEDHRRMHMLRTEQPAE